MLATRIRQKEMQAWDEDRSARAFLDTLRPWSELAREFRADGFFERFPAKGQVERVRRIHVRLKDELQQS